MARTATEVEIELADIRAAITAIIKGGQSYTIGSGGSTRQVTLVNLKDLKAERNELIMELNSINGCGDPGIVVGAGW